MNPGSYTFPFSYQLPDGLPGSFYERAPLSSVQPGTEWIDNDGMSADSWYDSDDEYGGQRSRGPHDYQRSAIMGAIVYKLKVTLDVNGIFMPDLWTKASEAYNSMKKQVELCSRSSIGLTLHCATLLPLASAGAADRSPEAGRQPAARNAGVDAAGRRLLLHQQGHVHCVCAVRQAGVRCRGNVRRSS